MQTAMLTPRPDEAVRFTRRDAGRLAIAAAVLVVLLTAILAIDIIPARAEVEPGSVAAQDIRAPRAHRFISVLQTNRLREEARAAVGLQYDYSEERARTVSLEQLGLLRRDLIPVGVAFAEGTPADERRSILAAALPGLSDASRQALLALEPERWAVLQAEAERVLDLVQRQEIREPEVAETRATVGNRIGVGLDEAERGLVAEIVARFVVANSTYSQELTEAEQQRAADAVADVEVVLLQNQVIVREGEIVTAEHIEMIDQFGLREATPDLVRLAGWFLLAALLVGLLLAWVWRFRPEVWHRNNVLVLVGLLLVFTAFALKLTAGRATLPFLIPTAAVGMLLAILLDAGAATVVVAVIAVIAGAVHGNSLELMAYTFLGGFAGIVAVRRGDRLQVFLQAGIAVFIVNALVVSTFSLLGTRDLTGVVQLWAASAAAAGGAAIAAVGSFAVLGNLFGILTVFQLLELANPSQPLLRRLLVETPGTYHHSIMVGNLAERAAEAIGADPLLTRVAAYYHDLGKLANPMAFIENQAGAENIHDQLEPEVSAQVLKQHVADGINIAYEGRLPKSLIAFIPQHHGTAIMSYFYARAREQAAEPFGGPTTAEGRAAADAVDPRRFRHAGPKPQTREAALIMLADGVEASVRSLSSRDEPAIRAMVTRIIEERLNDGQFDECDLTLRDVEHIREAFVTQLLGMYHQRIAYPQNKVVEFESRRGTGSGPGA
ncbi:MAG TPA: HDIG domain-containing protein [Candidatus Limnocylindrales bacterium]|nr:HDIG domain-containing protein [Candidatus Limnocylindrales bacterium]